MKEKRGGKRENAGRKKKFNEPTTYVAFYIPNSKVIEFKEYANKKIKEYQKPVLKC